MPLCFTSRTTLDTSGSVEFATFVSVTISPTSNITHVDEKCMRSLLFSSTLSFCVGCFFRQVLQAFRTDPGVKVLLISLKAGGVALNLTVANHIFLMDP